MNHRTALFFIITIWGSISPAIASNTCVTGVAKVMVQEGRVETRRAGGTAWEASRVDQTLCPGDTIAARENGKASIRLSNNTLLRLDRNSAITFSEAAAERPSLLEMLKGKAYFLSRTPRLFNIKTPFVNASVEGTEFQISLAEKETEINLFEGRLALQNEAGAMRLAAGETALARSGSAPFLGTRVTPHQAVTWALYYPPLFDFAASSPVNGPELMELLAAGKTEEVRAALAAANDRTASANLLAMQSIQALIHNRNTDAGELAQRAVSSAPDEAGPALAYSYVMQSNGDITGALAKIADTIGKNPRHAVLHARYAELLLINGEIGRSREFAAKAVALNPEVDTISGITGFTLLADRRPAAARDSFRAATEKSPTAPMPHLGLGIALIALHDVTTGREQIELAAALDPTNSLLRSYLAKSYIEEHRLSDAGKQLVLAKELDPNDPTPFLYSAYLEQLRNSPAEALSETGQSIARNDNRLVYRSHSFLDQDLAVRLTSLAKTYSTLGFGNLALAEAARGLTSDPDSPAAHRFLADGYATLPRHQIARVSELLQSQLLNPLAADALQPHLHESRLGVADTGASAAPGYNEYGSLFGKRGLSAQVGGTVGSEHLWGNETVVSGNLARGTISLGQYHQQADGFRPNADYRQDIYRVFAQGVLSSNAGLQAEYRYRTFKHGDIDVRFDQNDFLTSFRQDDTTHNVRLGGKLSLNNNSTLIASLLFGKATYKTDDSSLDPTLFIFPYSKKTADEAYGAEFQHLYRATILKLVSGMRAITLSRTDTMDIPLLPLADSKDSNPEFYSLYSYGTLSLPAHLNLIAGAGLERSRGGDLERNLLTPKFGLVWNPLPQTTFRAAAFRTLAKPYLAHQTIEPTNVAGFNQLYDDYESTSAWRYGIGIDQKIADRLFIGGEYSWRDLSVPVINPLTGSVQPYPWKEKMGRGYINAVLHRMLSATAEYRYERFERDIQSPSPIQEVTTHIMPLGLKLHHPSGLSTTLLGTMYKQKGIFTSNTSGQYSGSDRFWLLDATVSYSLPKRLGSISLEGKNLAKAGFNYQETDPWSPTILPGRRFTLNCSLNF